MSNFIPMVSSSPPPMDNDKAFEWEEDGEEFGTFTGVNSSGGDTNLNWSNTKLPISPEESPSKDIDFADFKSFNENSPESKPHVSDLPLKSNITIPDEKIPSHMSESVESLDLNDKNTIPTSLKRDSDSGMFSSDLSPLPVSEEGLVSSENCDVNDKTDDSSPVTPVEMVDYCDNIVDESSVSQHLEDTVNESPITAIQTETQTEKSLKPIPLVDSDQEIDDFSSNVLQTISSSSAANSPSNPPIDNDNLISENLDLTIDGESERCSDDEFGDFADFSKSKSICKSVESNKDSIDKNTAAIGSEELNNELNDEGSLAHINSDSDKSNELTSNSMENAKEKFAEFTSCTSNNVIISNSENHSNDLNIDRDSVDSSTNIKSANILDSDDCSNKGQKSKSDSIGVKLSDDDDDSAKISEVKSSFDPKLMKEVSDVTKNLDHDNQQIISENDDDLADYSSLKVSDKESSKVNSNGDNDFADFNSAKANLTESSEKNQSVNSDNDDDDDFADFSSAKIDDRESLKDNKNVASNDDDDDDNFTDFSSAKIIDKESAKDDKTVTSNVDDDDFADFSSAKIIDNDDDNFADFSGAKIIDQESSKDSNTVTSNSDDFRSAKDPKDVEPEDNDVDNDFADFSSAKISDKKSSTENQSEDEHDDNDEFTDFSSANITNVRENKPLYSESNDNNDDDDDDDFADFSSAKFEKTCAISNENNQNAPEFSDDEEEFADFSSANIVREKNSFKPSNKVEDEWGNFSDDNENEFCKFNEGTVINEEPKTPAVSRAPSTDKINTVIFTCFNKEESETIDNGTDITLLDSLLQGSLYEQMNKPLTEQDIMMKVLKYVEDYDNTNALLYQWKKSHSNNKLFTTLKIDTQNMLFGLKKQAVPLSVPGLTLLEPIRGQQDLNKKDKGVANLVEPSSTDSLPQIQDMPPVEFDWHNSGLTNPLEAKTLDLDFMVLQENENSIKAGVFQSELLDAPRSSVKPMQPLEDILKNMKLTTTTTIQDTNKNENLSKEAEAVINSLPLLSFMKSKVLMFKLNS